MFQKRFTSVAMALASTAMLATPALANILTGASATADCTGFTLTVNATDLNPGDNYEIQYSFTLSCGGNVSTPGGSIFFTADSTGNATETASGTWNSGNPLTSNCTVTGSATLTSSGSTVPITVNGSNSATLSCATGGGGGTPKSFSIGPSSMEGDLHISPGDWISGGYNFKFVSASHAATLYTVTATVTVPVSCPDGSVQNIVIPLGAPGQLDGGGVTTYTYSIAAGDTKNHASGDQNSILVWEGAVQAPATLCGGVDGRNQTGAVFNATVSESPQVGLVDWQFHYRDPAAKNNPNTDCTDASDPNRNKAAVCGASWSQTMRDP